MSSQPVPNPPPGFEKLSKEEQIEYVQGLWNQIAADEDEVPIPQWHREILRQRLATESPDELESWDDIKQRLNGRLRTGCN
jgi:putative addiction module component (TIGR02574 family)